MQIQNKNPDKAALEQLSKLLPKKAMTYVNTTSFHAGYPQKILMDMERLGMNPYALLPNKPFALHEDTAACLVPWASLHPNYNVHSPQVTVELPTDIMTPRVPATNADTERMLTLMGYTKGRDQLWNMAGHKVDLINFEVDGDAIMAHSAVITPMGNAVRLDQEATMFMIVSLMIRYSKAEPLHNIEAAGIRELRTRLAAAFDSQKMGKSDDLRKSFELSKTAILPLTFDHFGWALVGEGVMDKGLLYSKLAHKIPGLGGHHQGKYWIPFSATGIYISNDVMHTPTGVPITSSIVGLEDESQLNRIAILGSTDLAKWFKRHTLGILETARLVNPEIGKMKVMGHTQEGIDLPVLLVMGGIPLPFKGAALALAPQRELGPKLAHYREWIYQERWSSELPVRGPAKGTAVKAGDILATGGPGFELVCKREGYILDHKSMVVDGETRVSVNVGTHDRTGQIKGRDFSGSKWSLTYSDFLNVPWSEVYKHFGIDANAYIHQCGDTAILGLNQGEKPMVEINEDANKGTGKGLAAAEVNLAAQTLGVEVDYNVHEHFKGTYKPLLDEFEAKCKRRVTTFHAVDATTFKVISRAIDLRIAEPNVSAHELELHGNKYYIVRQEADAYMAHTLIKVESLPVADNLTVQRTPGEVAVTANTVGMHKVAAYLDEKGEDQINQYLALQRTAWSIYAKINDREAIAQSLSGHQTRCQVIDLNVEQHPELLARLLKLSESSLNLNSMMKPVIIGRFDENGNPEIHRRNEYGEDDPRAIIIDPVVIKAFGGGRDESSIESLTRELFLRIANKDEAKDINRVLARLRGAILKSASVDPVAKRVIRGCVAVAARTRPGYINPNWVAMSYYGNVARELAKQAGWKGNGHPTDRLWGQVCVMYRSPQTTPTPQRIYFPDAPADAVEAAKLLGNWPDGAERYGLQTGSRMEPDTFYVSPLATAADNGDHDGDSRALALILEDEAANEAKYWDWESHRKAVFKQYMLVPQDPAVYAYEHDPKKLKFAQPTETTLAKLVELTTNSIRNQTLHIGTAHSHGHFALVLSDLRPGSAVKAQSLMFGHYEEQLAGLNDKFFQFYETLNRARQMGKDWEPAMKALTTEIGHSEADWAAFRQVHLLVEAYSYVGRNQQLHPMMKVESGEKTTIRPEETLCVLMGGIYRCLSKGQLGNKLLKYVMDNKLIDLIRQDVPKNSLVGKQVLRFFDRVMPEVNFRAFPESRVDDLF